MLAFPVVSLPPVIVEFAGVPASALSGLVFYGGYTIGSRAVGAVLALVRMGSTR